MLDEAGHAHLTDFNLATRLEKNELATSFSGHLCTDECINECLTKPEILWLCLISGTRPYMAPEILSCSLGQSGGYDERVDWWSLGATLHEMLRGRLPFPLPSSLHNQQVISTAHRFPKCYTSFIHTMYKLSKQRFIHQGMNTSCSSHFFDKRLYIHSAEITWWRFKWSRLSFKNNRHVPQLI